MLAVAMVVVAAGWIVSHWHSSSEKGARPEERNEIAFIAGINMQMVAMPSSFDSPTVHHAIGGDLIGNIAAMIITVLLVVSSVWMAIGAAWSRKAVQPRCDWAGHELIVEAPITVRHPICRHDGIVNSDWLSAFGGRSQGWRSSSSALLTRVRIENPLRGSPASSMTRYTKKPRRSAPQR
jgi:hypothetical protein